MESSLTWLDFSERERRRALDVIDQFQEESTRDELGVGSIRDAIADLLFPGTSTVQTRARYFLFVPWIYLILEDKGIGYPDIELRARKYEIDLIYALVKGRQHEGVIGIEAREQLQRLPSDVYWSGLRQWGILVFNRSQEEYHRWLDHYYTEIELTPAAEDGEGTTQGTSANWHPHLPSAPEDFLEKVSFDLTSEEAEYLTDRIRLCVGDSLLAHLVERGIGGENADFPWTHPRFAHFPAHLRVQLDHARNFSESIHGAALLYNLLLAESTHGNDLIDEYRELLDEWWEVVQAARATLTAWDRKAFWTIVHNVKTHRTPMTTQSFVEQWLEVTFAAPGLESLIDSEPVRQVIVNRERQLKKARARIGNGRALEEWNGSSGTARLSYRWPVARDIIDDIVRAQEAT